MINRRQALALAMASTATLTTGQVWAQDAAWPTKPITLVLPFPAGGQTDGVARMLAKNIEPLLGQPVVVDNRPGANSLIGTTMVARSTPDGHTLLLNMTALVSNPILLPNVSYDPHKEFAPVARLYEIPALWAVPGNGSKTLAEFIEKAKAAKEPLNFGTTGHASSSHYYGEMFARAANIKLNHIPYKGEAPMLPDLSAGRVDAGVVSSASGVTFGADGRLRLLAVSGSHRWKALPDVPTFQELGIPGITTESFCGIFAPAGTPKSVVEKLNKAINQVMATPEFQKQMLAYGLEVAPVTTPEQFAAIMRKAADEWTAIKKDSSIRIDQ
ncbi:MAG: tripartite tricarboxylate transporter substrate binding protein [Porticoccaceae bacterium]